MKKCELLVTTEDGQISAGTVVLQAGKVTVQPKKGHEILMADVLETSHIVNDKRVSLRDNAKVWFDALPSFYNGSRLRARMVE